MIGFVIFVFVVFCFFFFFFSSRRRHTRSLRDWSSDVCSSDLLLFAVMGMGAFLSVDGFFDRAAPWLATRVRTRARSEERRVGKECRSRWLAYPQKKKKEKT